MMREIKTGVLLIACWIGIVFCLAAFPERAFAQAAPVLKTTCTTKGYGQLGEIYKNGIRYGNGFTGLAGSICKDYSISEVEKRAKAAGVGTYKDGFDCHDITYFATTCETVVVPPPVVPPPVTPPVVTPPVVTPPVVTPPVVTPPVVVAPPVVTSPGYGQIPPGGARVSVGYSTDQIQPTTEKALPAGDGNGAFRTVCDVSHYAFDDPIVWPGQPGRSHLHMFFGNTATNASSTAASTLASGNSTCRGGTVNRSAYWVPALINMSTNIPVNADKIDSYYKTNTYLGVQAKDINPIPTGLRMLAGDASNRTAELYTRPYSWKCHNNGAVKSATIILDCPVGDQMELEVNFPSCWDGKNLDSPDGRSHMRYASNGCPASHPVAIPEVSFHVLWPITKVGEARTWRLSSDTYEGPAGLSAHADWVGAWRKDVSDSFSLNCVGKSLDCHSHLTGDGRALY